MRALSLVLLLWCGAAQAADTPMSAEAFERYATGRTLYFGADGLAYGAEQYLPGRQVIWTFLNGECQHGHWYEEAGQICFVYEDRPDAPQCWSFYQDGAGVSARFQGDPEATELYEVQKDDAPLICPGPEVGV